jgi:hypothetical protein
MGADRPTPSFSRKRIDEDLKLSFDFTNDLASAETISTADVTATVHSGTDASPQNIVSGPAAISGQVVTQLIINGLQGVTYLLECEITTDQAQTVHLVGLLPVSDTESA